MTNSDSNDYVSFFFQQFIQQQANQQQNYPHDIGKNFGNPQLVPGQALAQQNMYQQQQQRQPAVSISTTITQNTQFYSS